MGAIIIRPRWGQFAHYKINMNINFVEFKSNG